MFRRIHILTLNYGKIADFWKAPLRALAYNSKQYKADPQPPRCCLEASLRMLSGIGLF